MKTFILFSVAVIVGLVTAPVSADIVYEFGNDSTVIGGGLDGLSTGSFTQSGVSGTAELTASTSLAGEVFNSNSSGFGINQAASSDDTNAFDFDEIGGPGVAEGLVLSFDTNVLLESIDVSSFGADDEIQVLVGGTTVATIDSTGETLLGAFAVDAGTDILINTTAGNYGNGWSLESFGVTVAPVPEPAAVTLLGLFSLGAFARRRRS